MRWADRLFRLAAFDPDRKVDSELTHLSQASAERAARLTAHARLAPTAGYEAQLTRLAGAETARGDALRTALRERGVEPPAPPIIGSEDGHNHWTRVVTDLDACRAAREHLLRVQPALVEQDPRLADMLGSQVAGLREQAEELRALSARADPQARN